MKFGVRVGVAWHSHLTKTMKVKVKYGEQLITLLQVFKL